MNLGEDEDLDPSRYELKSWLCDTWTLPPLDIMNFSDRLQGQSKNMEVRFWCKRLIGNIDFISQEKKRKKQGDKDEEVEEEKKWRRGCRKKKTKQQQQTLEGSIIQKRESCDSETVTLTRCIKAMEERFHPLNGLNTSLHYDMNTVSNLCMRNQNKQNRDSSDMMLPSIEKHKWILNQTLGSGRLSRSSFRGRYIDCGPLVKEHGLLIILEEDMIQMAHYVLYVTFLRLNADKSSRTLCFYGVNYIRVNANNGPIIIGCYAFHVVSLALSIEADQYNYNRLQM
ncbi:uncharacterized protein V6R79_005696 [Siganus canaliculatus]